MYETIVLEKKILSYILFNNKAMYGTNILDATLKNSARIHLDPEIYHF